MASLILDFLTEAEAAKQYEDDRILGNEVFLAIPGHILGTPGHAEAQEAITWERNRSHLIGVVIEAVKALVADGYPERLQQVAEQAVIDEYTRIIGLITKTTNEFVPPPTGTITGGKETPIPPK